ncbi:hypothetical protein [Pseudoalteromonas mariniglutinosa]|uniref:hypothetical protein n=1 Tax=Pseudoalteromonas mariniglutinosa TaxID=206042 RepID=UPI00384C413A
MINLSLTSSVGEKGYNSSNDVYLVKALLNSYARRANIGVLSMTSKVDPATLSLIEVFQRQVVRMGKPDRLVSSGGGTFNKLIEHLKLGFIKKSLTAPSRGLLTWEAEGQEGGLYHSRALHVPSPSSGLTLGRGYDMRDKSSSFISSQLVKAGLNLIDANRLAAAARLKGRAAESFIIQNDLLDFEISPQVQLALFRVAYAEKEQIVLRICKKADTVAVYGAVDWSVLPKSLLELFVDLTYRGDYSGLTRKFLQKPLAQGNVQALKTLFSDRSKWSSVPYQRFELRSKYASTISVNKLKNKVTP